ncbi:MAG: methylglyoxal synthase [Chloroflexi bacterium]|nr:methylglyoxal synthase [Chloroflexota bacterium]
MTDYTRIPLRTRKHIGLIAHDGRKQDLLEWVRFNQGTLEQHVLYATGTTGALIQRETGLEVIRLKSGPLGGDQQMGALIAEGEIDFLIFFWDPMEPQPHDPDVKALLRIAVLYNIPTASNRSTADFLISSPLMTEPYERLIPDYKQRIKRPPYLQNLLEEADSEEQRDASE